MTAYLFLKMENICVRYLIQIKQKVSKSIGLMTLHYPEQHAVFNHCEYMIYDKLFLF